MRATCSHCTSNCTAYSEEEAVLPSVEVFEGEYADKPIFIAEFFFLPQIGEYIARDAGGYFKHYNVVEVWHRQDAIDSFFRPCIRVILDD